MTSLSPINNKAFKKTTTMTVLAVMVFVLLFLTSTFVHANHLTEHSINNEQQECHICHQGLDTPPELAPIQLNYAVSYYLKLQKIINVHFDVSYFMQPQLRAPPTFQ